MDYWFYENWRERTQGEFTATIHEGPCSYCKHGKGMDKPKPRDGENGKWHGPFGSLAVAEQSAAATKRLLWWCMRCKPGGKSGATDSAETERYAEVLVCDQAHRTAQVKQIRKEKVAERIRNFTLCHDQAMSPAGYRLYQTSYVCS